MRRKPCWRLVKNWKLPLSFSSVNQFTWACQNHGEKKTAKAVCPRGFRYNPKCIWNVDVTVSWAVVCAYPLRLCTPGLWNRLSLPCAHAPCALSQFSSRRSHGLQSVGESLMAHPQGVLCTSRSGKEGAESFWIPRWHFGAVCELIDQKQRSQSCEGPENSFWGSRGLVDISLQPWCRKTVKQWEVHPSTGHCGHREAHCGSFTPSSSMARVTNILLGPYIVQRRSNRMWGKRGWL